jgi:sugar phosphate isomerase/epimerase
LHIRNGLHLTYCTNIHAADGWDAVFANIRRFAPALKARFAPAAPFGVGLRLSAREARELLDGQRLRDFRSYLDDQGLYVAIINGFPYGHFHGAPVKADVYAPDWRDDARVRYTLDLIQILRALVPKGLDGGVSTAPLSYKPWMKGASAADWDLIIRHVVRVASALARIRAEDGLDLHLDIEPEPDCVLENTDESLEFFERLMSDGAHALSASDGVGVEHARERLRDHIALCFDCCHFAVEYEDPAAALERFRTAGLKIGRVQLSSALRVQHTRESKDDATAAALLPFADSTYLHQVVEQSTSGIRRFPDLDVALGQPTQPLAEWRIHFHVPLFAREYQAFGSTQDYVRSVLDLAYATEFTRHLEIETYTWDVLPAGLKIDLLDSIAREYEWVLASLDARSD